MAGVSLVTEGVVVVVERERREERGDEVVMVGVERVKGTVCDW